MEETSTPVELTVDEAHKGERLDVTLAALMPGLSRSKAQRLIEAGLVTVDNRQRPQGFRVLTGARIRVSLPKNEERPEPAQLPEELEVLFEDGHVLAIAKRPGLVVHPGAGHRSGTLTDILKRSGRVLSTIGGPDRPGLVHRLDRDTSGVVLVAKDDRTHEALSRQFKERTVRKAYLALVLGPKLPDHGVFATHFSRRSSDRKQFTSRVTSGREAVTEYRTLLRGGLCAFLLVLPKTGRTHQIRVHLAEGGHPIVGDRVYGRAYPRSLTKPEADALRLITRQALHAWAIRFEHPWLRQEVLVKAPVPRDLALVLDAVFGKDWPDCLPEDPFAGA